MDFLYCYAHILVFALPDLGHFSPKVVDFRYMIAYIDCYVKSSRNDLTHTEDEGLATLIIQSELERLT